MYSRVLSATEVNTLFTSTQAIVERPLNTVIIGQLLQSDHIIHLAEVQLFLGSAQIPRARASLTFTLSNPDSSLVKLYPASNCNDGNLNNFCHSDSSDPNPSLDIRSTQPFDKVVVYNRDSNPERINGAVINVNSIGGPFSSQFSNVNQSIYTFTRPSLETLDIASTYSNAPSNGLQLHYRTDSVSGTREGNIASGSVVYDATLNSSAMISNKQVMFDATKKQFMSIDPFTIGLQD